MKSLRQTRKDKQLSLKDLESLTGISYPNLSQIERGQQSPGTLTRRKIESILGRNVNWLDVPKIESPPRMQRTWDDCERSFRTLLWEINSLSQEEKKAFINSAIHHLKNLLK